MFKRVHKERVEIIHGNLKKKAKKYKVIEGNFLEIKKGGKGRGNISYRPSFNPSTSFIYYKGKLGGLKRKLMLVSGAKKCIEFTKNVKVPSVDPETMSEYFKAHVVKSAGATTQKVDVPLILYILIGLGVFLSLLNFLASRGVVL